MKISMKISLNIMCNMYIYDINLSGNSIKNNLNWNKAPDDHQLT